MDSTNLWDEPELSPKVGFNLPVIQGGCRETRTGVRQGECFTGAFPLGFRNIAAGTKTGHLAKATFDKSLGYVVQGMKAPPRGGKSWQVAPEIK